MMIKNISFNENKIIEYLALLIRIERLGIFQKGNEVREHHISYMKSE